jgi:hypothetical protein
VTRVAQLLAIAALAALSAACGGSGGTGATAGEPISFEQLSQAASTSAEATSGRFSFTLEGSSPELEQELGFSGEGAFDATAERSSFSADLSSIMALLGGLFAGVSGGDGPDFDDPSLWTVEIVRDGSQTFMKLPAIASKLPDGELVEAAGLKLQEFDRFTGADPKQLLDVLRELSGEIEVVGREALRGVETTHYRATVDAESIAKSASKETGDDLGDLTDRLVGQSGLSEVPIDVWIDGDGILRKVVLDVEATQPGSSAPSRALLGFELWDLGEPVTIELPPSSEVVDVTRLER